MGDIGEVKPVSAFFHADLVTAIEEIINKAEDVGCTLTAHRLKQALDAAKRTANENGYDYEVAP